jgi:hypothetical protein
MASSDGGTKTLLDALWAVYRAGGLSAVGEFLRKLDQAREAV